MYGKVPLLIVKKTNRLTQAVVFFRRHFLCGALLCNCSSAEREVYLHMTCTTGMFSRTLHAQHPVTTNLFTSPRFSPTIFYRDANSVPTSTPFYSSISKLYAQNLGFEIVREESVKVYLHMCVCVFFPFILDIKFVGRTSRGHTGGRSHRIPHPPSFCGACLNFFREKDSAIPFPRRP